MRSFDRIEEGLPARSFLHLRSADSQADMPGRRRASFVLRSPWNAFRSVAERLTWRGRNYIEAFAQVNHGQLVHAAVFDLPADRHLPAFPEGDPGQTGIECYHLVCRASPGSSIRLADSLMPLKTGDLWRVSGLRPPAILKGGCEDGVHIAFALRRQTPDPARPDQKFQVAENNAGAAA